MPKFKMLKCSYILFKTGFIITMLGITSCIARSIYCQSLSDQSSIFYAGAALTKITPPVGSIMGNSYGITVCKGVNDDLYIRTLVFKYGSNKAAFIALDMISLPYRVVMETRELIARTTDIPEGNIIMSATHIHAGPQMNPLFWDVVGGEPKQKSEEYVKRLPEMIVKSVKIAITELQPVQVFFSSVIETSVNFNRRFILKDGTFKMNPGRMNPDIVRVAGPIDPEISVVFFESVNKKPIAMLVNFALHPAIVEGNMISADFPGVVCSLLSEVLGKEMVTVFTNGNSGNVNHIDITWINQPGGLKEAKRVGTIIAADVLKALTSLRHVNVTSLKVRTESVEVPVPTVGKKEFEWAKQVIAQYGKPKSPLFDDVVKAWRIIDIYLPEKGYKARHEYTTTVPLKKGGGALMSEVQAIVLGDELALVGFPGDAFVELGLAIKQNSPYPITIVSEQAGNGSLSYVPNYKAFMEGGYESESARFLPGGGEILVNAVIRILTELFPYK